MGNGSEELGYTKMIDKLKLPSILLVLLVCSTLAAQYVGRNLSENLGSGALPANCTVGDVVFRTDTAAGDNLAACTAADTWTVIGGSSQAYNPLAPVLAAGIDTGAVATTTILNETAAGRLISVGCVATGAIGGTPVASMGWNVDGEGLEELPIYVGSTTFSFSTQPIAQSMFGPPNPYGSGVGDGLSIYFGTEYSTSLLVQLDVTTGGTGGDIACVVLRARLL